MEKMLKGRETEVCVCWWRQWVGGVSRRVNYISVLCLYSSHFSDLNPCFKLTNCRHTYSIPNMHTNLLQAATTLNPLTGEVKI